MWLRFYGLDKSGKTTLEWSFLKATNYKHNIIDRGPVGYLVFDKVFGRSTKLGDQEFIKQARKVSKSKNFFVVYCRADKDVAEERLKLHNETCPYDYESVQKQLAKQIKRFYSKDTVLVVDTSHKSIEECTQEIVDWFMEKVK